MVLAAGAMRRSCGVVARRDRLRGDVAARSTNRVSKHVNQSRVVHQPHLHRLSHRDKKSRCPWSTATVVIEELQLEVFCFCSCSNVLYHLGLTVVLRALFMLPDGLFVSSMSNTRLMVATK